MPHKLLLADDSETIRRVIELTFADEDIQVIAVADGDQAIARLEADPPDIVLADVGMPGKDGYEVAAYVKQSPRLAHIPVVLLTGAFEPVDQTRANSVGCDGVLAKPFEPQLVISRVKELLGGIGRPPAPLDANLAPPPEPAGASWGPTLVEPAPVPTGAAGAKAPHLDDYFDRLDAAFSTLSASPGAVPGQPSDPPPAVEQIDWFASSQSPAPSDLPLSYGSRQAEFAAPIASSPAPRLEPAQPHERTVTPAAAPTPAPDPAPQPGLPPLADAFAALLAAEQGSPAAPPVWPVPAAPGLAVTDDLVEQTTRRVLERLSDTVVRDSVSQIVSTVAERLVREEIERIKSSIK